MRGHSSKLIRCVCLSGCIHFKFLDGGSVVFYEYLCINIQMYSNGVSLNVYLHVVGPTNTTCDISAFRAYVTGWYCCMHLIHHMAQGYCICI